MKIIIAPDKFKGSLTSMQACKSIAAGIFQVDNTVEILSFPMADGGDGFAEVLQHYLHTQNVSCSTVDPLMRSINACYQWDEKNKIAIIELATASGLQLLSTQERNPLHTSTYGTGLLIQHAITKGAEKIILGLGGSATNDAGIGILVALGFIFLDNNGNNLSPVGENLQHIKNIISPTIIPAIHFIIACDVQNVLYGAEGAARIYAAQKGADENAIKILDDGLQQFAAVAKLQTSKDISNFAGAGAAGGAAAGLMAYFGIEIIQGAQMVIAASGIQDQLKDTHLIITGEGKLDSQSSKGKVVQHIAALGRQNNIPVIALCGIANVDEQQLKEMGFLFVKSIVGDMHTEMEAVQHAKELLAETAAAAFAFYLHSAK